MKNKNINIMLNSDFNAMSRSIFLNNYNGI